MPRTIATEPPGCPSIRAITSDVLGLLKGESRSPTPRSLSLALNNSFLQLYSLRERNRNTRLLIRGVPLILPGTCSLRLLPATWGIRSNMFAACTEKGHASLNYFQGGDTAQFNSPMVLKLCNSGSICCFSIDGSDTYSAVGGKGVEVSLWDLNTCSKTWTAKSPPLNSLRIFTPPWITTLAFLEKEDHRKIVTGTCQHQVRLYDIAAQRRPVRTIDFRESPIKVVTEDPDGFTVYVGNGTGDLASFDMRTGKMIGSFVGKCSGSIKSIARHPELPVLASCGLDRYLRLWDIKTRQLLEAMIFQLCDNLIRMTQFTLQT